jgi:intracellular sulfur oxidation DsrE/DsrF family protein
VGACQNTMRRQSIKPEDLIEGLTPIPSGVARVMELQEEGYAYIRP